MFYSKSTGGFYRRGDKIPADAVEISGEYHRALLDGESAGKIIAADSEGRPILIDRPAPTNEELSVDARAQRDALLSACDWTQCRDVPDATAAAWQPYRQALRDLTKQAEFPGSVVWPIAPK